jgi:hypothetical protein
MILLSGRRDRSKGKQAGVLILELLRRGSELSTGNATGVGSGLSLELFGFEDLGFTLGGL